MDDGWTRASDTYRWGSRLSRETKFSWNITSKIMLVEAESPLDLTDLRKATVW